MFDILSNHKICNLRTVAQQTPGTATQLEVDLQEEDTGDGHFERSERALLLIEVTVVAAGATLDLTVQDYGLDTAAWDVDFAVIDQITATGIYLVDLKKFRQKLRLSAVVANDNITWGAKAICFEATRRPVVQTDADSLDITYATNRANEQAA